MKCSAVWVYQMIRLKSCGLRRKTTETTCHSPHVTSGVPVVNEVTVDVGLDRSSVREPGLPGCEECRQQTASSCQLLQGLPQLQKNCLMQSHTLPGASTSCDCTRRRHKGPCWTTLPASVAELPTRLAKALLGLHQVHLLPFPKSCFRSLVFTGITL